MKFILLILHILVGILALFAGLRIWKNQKFSLLRENYWEKVEDIRSFCIEAGRALFGMGLFLIFLGIITLYVNLDVYVSILFIGGAIFITCITKIKKKYTGCFFK